MRRFLVLAALAACCGGCWMTKRVEYLDKPVSPLAADGIHRVAVIGLNATEELVCDPMEVAETWSTELQQFKGIDVYPAAVTAAAVRDRRLLMPDQADKLAALLGVDATLVVMIDDYDPYDHPRVGTLLILYPAAKDATLPAEGQPIVPAAPLVSLKKVYDSDVKEVADEVHAFAADRDAQQNPLGYREYLLVMSRYLHFVADRSIRDLFAKVRQGQEAAAAAEDQKRRQSQTHTAP